MWSKTKLILFALTILATTEAAKKRFTIEVHQINCTNLSPANLVKYLNCDFEKKTIGRYAINVKFVLERVLNRNAMVQVMVHLQKGNKNVLKFFDVKLNICELLSKALSMPLIKQILNEAMRTSNIPRTCPVKGNIPYNVNNFILTDEYFPIYTPTLNFTFTLNFYENQKQVVIFFLQGVVVDKN